MCSYKILGEYLFVLVFNQILYMGERKSIVVYKKNRKIYNTIQTKYRGCFPADSKGSLLFVYVKRISTSWSLASPITSSVSTSTLFCLTISQIRKGEMSHNNVTEQYSKLDIFLWQGRKLWLKEVDKRYMEAIVKVSWGENYKLNINFRTFSKPRVQSSIKIWVWQINLSPPKYILLE